MPIPTANLAPMKRKHKALFITNLPSPYRRDLFGAVAARDDVELSVYYMDTRSCEKPMAEKMLRGFESLMPGFSLPLGGGRYT
jgi:hypothetical protein